MNRNRPFLTLPMQSTQPSACIGNRFEFKRFMSIIRALKNWNDFEALRISVAFHALYMYYKLERTPCMKRNASRNKKILHASKLQTIAVNLPCLAIFGEMPQVFQQ